MNWKNKRIYISGGSSGIGLAAARMFAELGSHVLLFSVDDESKLKEALASLRAKQRSDAQRFEALRLDVTDPEPPPPGSPRAAQPTSARAHRPGPPCSGP